jgi:hypothetical protein
MAGSTSVREDEDFVDLIREEGKFSIDAHIVLEWVENNFDPERVFSADCLEEWALANGFVREA